MSSGDRIKSEIERRRTFAIISHPDAGKTTLTEQLLLQGGVIQLAGAVKAKRGRSATVSDWMDMERERGISITTSVLQFPYGELRMNLLDTPGHADFSEDTYRTLHAVDAAVMVLDRAKGVEAQTRKLFRVCRRRAIPVFTFVNKMDRPGRDPFDLVGEVESVLGIGVFPVTWPIFHRDAFRGVYHRFTGRAHLYAARPGAGVRAETSDETLPLDDPRLRDELDAEDLARLREELAILDAAGDAFDRDRFEAGELSPLFFGSALGGWGLVELLDSFRELMPPPRPRAADTGEVPATAQEFSGFVFKIQANMNRAHRDRVAFVRICSGRFERGMKVRHVRTGREMRIANPTQLLANDQSIVEESFAGDVVGIFDPGVFEIGDTLTAGARFEFERIPSFAPEHFARLVLRDPMRRKQLTRGIEQLAKEGTIQLYRAPGARAGDLIVGAIGLLQLEVTAYRLLHEYDADVRTEPVRYRQARWVTPRNGQPLSLDELARSCSGLVVVDVRDRPVVLFEDEWAIRFTEERLPAFAFSETASGIVAREAPR